MTAPNPNNIPQPQTRTSPRSTGRFTPGSFLVNNLKQQRTPSFADPSAAHVTTLQSDFHQGHTFTPAQPGDRGKFNTSANERQQIALGATPLSGTFILSFNSNNSQAITALTATGNDVQVALEPVTGIGIGQVAGSGSAGGPWDVEFKGTLSRQNVSALVPVPDGLVFPMTGAQLSDAGVFTDQLAAANNATVNDINLLPSTGTIDVNDAYYFGAQFPFAQLNLTVGTAGVGAWAVAWEFWNGSAWTAVSGLTDGTTAFTVSGAKTVVFTLPTTWATTAVNGVTAYWLRSRVTTGDAAPTTRPLGTIASVTKTSGSVTVTTIQNAA